MAKGYSVAELQHKLERRAFKAELLAMSRKGEVQFFGRSLNKFQTYLEEAGLQDLVIQTKYSLEEYPSESLKGLEEITLMTLYVELGDTKCALATHWTSESRVCPLYVVRLTELLDDACQNPVSAEVNPDNENWWEDVFYHTEKLRRD